MSSTQTVTLQPGSYRNIISQTLGQPRSHESLTLLRRLYDAHPTSAHVPLIESTDSTFPLSRYLESQEVAVNIQSHFLPVEGEPPRLAGDTYLMYLFDDKSKRVFPSVIAGCSTFSYNGTFFTAYKATWATPDGSEIYFYDLVADSEDAGKDLAQKVYVYGETLREEIWVYQSGRWTANKQLYQAIQAANWNDVILDDSFKDGLRRDTQGFFESKDIYDDLGTVWKRLVLVLFFFAYLALKVTHLFIYRGILLLGPPGNGKTESIKALLKETQYPALYVKSFTTPYVSFCLCNLEPFPTLI